MDAKDSFSAPWWWTRIVSMLERIANIHKAASNDPQGKVAPKELWVTGRDDELEQWFKDRAKSASDPQVLE